MREIREKRGLAYGVSTELVSFRHAGLILGSVATENARVAQSIALFAAEWRRMRDEGPSEAEARPRQGLLIGSFPLTLDTSARVASVLVEIQLENLGDDYLDRRAALFGGSDPGSGQRVARIPARPRQVEFRGRRGPCRSDPDPRRARPGP